MDRRAALTVGLRVLGACFVIDGAARLVVYATFIAPLWSYLGWAVACCVLSLPAGCLLLFCPRACLRWLGEGADGA